MHSLLTIFLACNSSDKENPDDSQNEPMELEELFIIPERPFDMTWDTDGTMLISADASGKLYRWDGQLLEEQQGFYHDIQAVHVYEDTLYHTTTDNGVTGALHDAPDNPLVTQSSDGTLFRWPVDITHAPDGSLLIADYNAGVIFSYQEDGTTQLFGAGSQTPLSIAFQDNSLYIGGEDGIWEKEWPDGIPSKIEDRSANGLVVHNGEIYASNSTDGIFLVGGEAYPMPENFGRPSSLLVKESVLYVIDQIGRGVWKSDL